jgi:hypothetical protein
MGYTALQGLNAILKRVKVVQGDSAAITSFTDTAKQHSIDLALQIINEVIHEMYDKGAVAQSTATGTITLATDTREYAVPSDFERMAGKQYADKVMITTDNVKIFEYPGGYARMFADQPDPTEFLGAPNFWAINSTNGQFRLDRTPQSEQNGDVYSFLYEKRLLIDEATDTFPFSDTVFDALLPVIAELWSVDQDADSRRAAYAGTSFVRAIKMARQVRPRAAYGVRRV